MISVIIPTLNEEDQIEKIIDHLYSVSSGNHPLEILIVDGGSEDNTVKIVSEFSHEKNIPLELINSERGRAKQMNTAANRASGEILYFLHADTLPPKDFDEHITASVKKSFVSGCFRLKFDSGHPVLKFSQWFTRFNFKFCRGGDQSLYILNQTFKDINGFNEEYQIYEDCELINRLYDNHNFVVMNAHVITSARTYEHIGAWKLQYHFTIIHLKKWLGASPEQLYSYYRKNISSRSN